VTDEKKYKFEALNPKYGVGYSYLNTTKAALKAIWSRRRWRGINNFSEDEVFGEYIKLILKNAKTQKHVQNKNNYVKKIDHASTPFATVDEVNKLEQYLYNKAITKHNARTVFSSLRDYMMFSFCARVSSDSTASTKLSYPTASTLKSREKTMLTHSWYLSFNFQTVRQTTV